MKGDRHVVEVGEKVLKLVSAFAREMRVGRGLTYGTVFSLYRKVVEPGMMYGVEFWGGEVLRREILRKKWLALQRKVIIKMISAYRTISAEAACVISGVEPIDLRIEMMLEVKEDVRGGTEKRVSEERRKVELVERWQQRWRESQKGRVTYEYMKRVERGGEREWKINHYVTQVLSGHGNFREKLRSFGLVESGLCEECGEVETEFHVVFVCARFEGQREELRRRVERGGGEWGRAEVMREEYREEFFEVVVEIMRANEESEESE